jgi:hypothetical protein
MKTIENTNEKMTLPAQCFPVQNRLTGIRVASVSFRPRQLELSSKKSTQAYGGIPPMREEQDYDEELSNS